MPKRWLHVVLPKNRRQVGEMWLKDGDAVILGPFECRGKADNSAAAKHDNPPTGSPSQRDPRRPYGDTPAGRWSACRIAARGHFHAGDGIGPVWIPLDREHAADGATKELLTPGANKSDPLHTERSNLGIHGGRGNGDLMATNGCLRVHDSAMTLLASALRATVFDVVIEDRPEPAKRTAT